MVEWFAFPENLAFYFQKIATRNVCHKSFIHLALKSPSYFAGTFRILQRHVENFTSLDFLCQKESQP